MRIVTIAVRHEMKLFLSEYSVYFNTISYNKNVSSVTNDLSYQIFSVIYFSFCNRTFFFFFLLWGWVVFFFLINVMVSTGVDRTMDRYHAIAVRDRQARDFAHRGPVVHNPFARARAGCLPKNYPAPAVAFSGKLFPVWCVFFFFVVIVARV